MVTFSVAGGVVEEVPGVAVGVVPGTDVSTARDGGSAFVLPPEQAAANSSDRGDRAERASRGGATPFAGTMHVRDVATLAGASTAPRSV